MLVGLFAFTALAQAPSPNEDSQTYSQLFVSQSYVPSLQRYSPSALSPDRQAAKDYIFERAKEAGLDPQVINQIIMCESGYNQYAKHLNKNGTWDIGIWQINDVHHISIEDREDLVKSTDYALLLIRTAGLKSWMCYKASN